MSNIYYEPSAFGMEQVADIEVREPDYSFDIVCVWRHLESHKLYAAFDSGCSCPTPFEDYTTIESLTPVRSMKDIEEFFTGDYCYGNKLEFLAQVRRALR